MCSPPVDVDILTELLDNFGQLQLERVEANDVENALVELHELQTRLHADRAVSTLPKTHLLTPESSSFDGETPLSRESLQRQVAELELELQTSIVRLKKLEEVEPSKFMENLGSNDSNHPCTSAWRKTFRESDKDEQLSSCEPVQAAAVPTTWAESHRGEIAQALRSRRLTWLRLDIEQVLEERRKWFERYVVARNVCLTALPVPVFLDSRALTSNETLNAEGLKQLEKQWFKDDKLMWEERVRKQEDLHRKLFESVACLAPIAANLKELCSRNPEVDAAQQELLAALHQMQRRQK